MKAPKRLLAGTRKGLILLEKKGGSFSVSAEYFQGIPVSMVYCDPRTNAWWAALDHGHWGIKLHRSDDLGATWTEWPAPKYPEGLVIKDEIAASLKYIWSIAAAGSSHPDKIYIGTEPGGLFESEGDGFALNESLWNHPSRQTQWFGAGRDYPGIHSIIVDPDDDAHIYVGISVAGVFETTDRGQSWVPKNHGLRAEYLPDPQSEVGQDPHLLVAHPDHVQTMWQQNHCGIFRSTDGGDHWVDISDPDGPADFGFAIALDQNHAERAWVAPAISDEMRMAVNGALCIGRTDDAGKSWQYFRTGLPQSHCYDLIYRHCLVAEDDDVLFGTTTGNLFHSGDGGENWQVVSNYLPLIYVLAFV